MYTHRKTIDVHERRDVIKTERFKKFKSQEQYELHEHFSTENMVMF